MMRNRVREIFNSDELLLDTRIHSPWANEIDMIGCTALNTVQVVAEYGALETLDFEHLCRAAEAQGLGKIIKIDSAGQQLRVQRAIGAGFEAVVFVDVHNRSETEECVRIIRAETPEDGGLNPVRSVRAFYPGYGGTQAYIEALREIVVILMIEKAEAVENLEAILSVKGVDGIIWGPGDFWQSKGAPEKRGTEEDRAIQTEVYHKALSVGVEPIVEINDFEETAPWLDMGIRMFSLGTTITILHAYWRKHGDGLQAIYAQRQQIKG